MVSTIPVAGTFSLSNSIDDAKERILFTLQVAVKQIQHCSSLQSEGDELSLKVKEVRKLCESLDQALFHGLKCYEKGYWPFAKSFTHSSSVKHLNSLKNAKTDIQRGRSWLCLALNESSLESYFRSFLQNHAIVKKHYNSPALICDEPRMQLLLMLTAGLEFVNINLDVENMDFGCGLSFFGKSFSENVKFFENEATVFYKPVSVEFPELLPCESASEVTCDFSVSTTISPTSPSHAYNTLHKSASSESNKTNESNDTIPLESMELISRYINIESHSEAKVDDDLEVVRTKVVRRTKRADSRKSEAAEDARVENENTNTIRENRLSKMTTDSGLCLETPGTSDNDSLQSDSESGSGPQISFHVDDFQQDFSVTFSTPKRKTSSSRSTDSKESKSSGIGERGAPEGQEDPVGAVPVDIRHPLLVCSDDLDVKDDKMDFDDEVEEEEEEISIYDLHKLSSLTSKDESSSSDQVLSFETEKDERMSVMGASCHESSCGDVVLQEMEQLGLEKPESFDIKVSNNILLYFIVEVFEHEEEIFHKLFCGYSHFSEGLCQRVYILLSNKSAYFLMSGNDRQKFFKCFTVRYSSINHITVDLNYQGFKVISRDKDCYSLYTANEEMTRNILSNLEWGIRRYIPKLPLPSMYTDASVQTSLITKFLASEMPCERSEVALSHYVLARWEDYTSSSVTPSGPVYQDYLMYRHKFVKENKATPWRPAFFLLKGGVLYCMEDEKNKPLFFVQMCAPHCRGCRRVNLLNRPHAFEIIRSNSDSLQLAAADTYEASKWLQCFLETVSLAGHFIDTEKDVQRPSCVLVANEKVIIANEEPRKRTYNLLGKANICDLVTIFVDPVTVNFVMLEFELAEASKSSGEWIIYFESASEKEQFLKIVCEQWSAIYHVDLSIENVKDLYLLKRYRQVADELQSEQQAMEDFCADN